ncbi:hypothetical protein [Fodinibius halophilus]|uniref:Uncharacterized protein n=1 Tax=Fodinibius halophilus TaxID=1736908 RepID=A0A6M1TN34_9BACT|nr:hypothetical protein [Fodinibius halophilus]NGP89760.1 hypothetical protein [Fodinibius halophilus]
MLDSKKLKNLHLDELTPEESRNFEGGNGTGVWDDPNDPDDGGCIPYPDPLKDIINGDY